MSKKYHNQAICEILELLQKTEQHKTLIQRQVAHKVIIEQQEKQLSEEIEIYNQQVIDINQQKAELEDIVEQYEQYSNLVSSPQFKNIKQTVQQNEKDIVTQKKQIEKLQEEQEMQLELLKSFIDIVYATKEGIQQKPINNFADGVEVLQQLIQ